MATILIWMSPEPSHVLPTIKLARDLRQSGHTVVYQVDHSLHSQLRGLGFCCHPFLEQISDQESAGLYSMNSSSDDWHARLRSRFGGDSLAAYKAASDDIQEAARIVGADLVLIDSLMNYIYGITVDTVAQPDLRVGFIQSHLALVLFGKNMAHTRRMLHRAHRTIILCPREFEVSDYEVEGGRYAEACIFLDRDETEFPWDWLDARRKLIYCALGSQSRLYSQAPQIFSSVLEVARRMPDCQFVISAGPHSRPLDALNSNDNCRVFPAVPQTGLLKKTAAMILHGGLGSIKECIYFGVPMLVLPFVNDQPLNAFRVQHHGLGLILPVDTITSDELYAALGRLLTDESAHTRSKWMQAVFRAREEQGIAAATCEEFLR